MEKKWGRDKPRIKLCYDPLEAVEKANVLVILTELQKFKEVDLIELKRRLQSPFIIDGGIYFRQP